MAKLRFVGTEPHSVPALGGRLVQPDEVIEIPDDLVWPGLDPADPSGYEWPAASWAPTRSSRRQGDPVPADQVDAPPQGSPGWLLAQDEATQAAWADRLLTPGRTATETLAAMRGDVAPQVPGELPAPQDETPDETPGTGENAEG